MRSYFNIIKTEGGFCPTCGKEVHLMMDEERHEGPAFYICFECHFIGQVGVGPVQEGKTQPGREQISGSIIVEQLLQLYKYDAMAHTVIKSTLHGDFYRDIVEEIEAKKIEILFNLVGVYRQSIENLRSTLQREVERRPPLPPFVLEYDLVKPQFQILTKSGIELLEQIAQQYGAPRELLETEVGLIREETDVELRERLMEKGRQIGLELGERQRGWACGTPDNE